MATTTRAGLRVVPAWIARPCYATTGAPPIMRKAPGPKHAQDYVRLRESAQLASTIRTFAGKLLKAGMTTDDLDRVVHDEIVRLGAYPSPLNYAGFPKSICTSTNAILCHGIPDQVPLIDGDLVKIDISLFYGGFHGDCCGSFVVGAVQSAAVVRLAKAAREACFSGIAVCAPGRQFSAIGVAIERFATVSDYSVSEAFTGHGIGRDLHELPHVMHTRSSVEYGSIAMQPGMVFTIEPILVEGADPSHVILDDGWSAMATTKRLAAQHEEMVGITDNGHEVLTSLDGDDDSNGPLYSRGAIQNTSQV